MSIPMPELRPIKIHTKTENYNILLKLYIWLLNPRKFEVVSDYFLYLDKYDITLKIPKGFVFDGASVPRLLWWFLNPFGILLIPGLFHDFGYKYNCFLTHNNKVVFDKKGRIFSDEIFFEVGKQINGMYFIDTLATIALFFGGVKAWNDHRKNNNSVYCDFGIDEIILAKFKDIIQNSKKDNDVYCGVSRKSYPLWSGWKYIDDGELESNELKKLLNNFYVKLYEDLNLNAISDNIGDLIFIQYFTIDTDSIKNFQFILNVLNKNKELYNDIVVDGIIGDKTKQAFLEYLKNYKEDIIIRFLKSKYDQTALNYAVQGNVDCLNTILKQS